MKVDGATLWCCAIYLCQILSKCGSGVEVPGADCSSCAVHSSTCINIACAPGPILPCNTGEYIFSLRSNTLNLWSFRNRGYLQVWSCLSLLPKLAQLQASHRWFWWPSCAIYCAFDLVEHAHDFCGRGRSHKYTSDMWVAPSMWLQYGEVPRVLLELRHLRQWQAWPNCTHPGRENSTDSTMFAEY